MTAIIGARMRVGLLSLATVWLAAGGCRAEAPLGEPIASAANAVERADRPASPPPAPGPAPERVVRVFEGKAIWYGGKWHGKKTASGERFDKEALTAAHRSLPFGTRVRVTSVASGRQVVVRINDRGPYGRDRRRIIDVSEAAARALEFGKRGSIRVRLEVLED